MTREEAIKELIAFKDKSWDGMPEEVIDVAIEALEQQPCGDAVSRQAVLDTIESWLSCDDYNDAERHIMRAMQSVLYDLPPVKPTEKVGHWIDADGDNAICGCCNRLNHLYGTYCKHCGAKMQEVEE